MIDFGKIDDEGDFQSHKMRVKVCGKEIYNYRSERAISRSGWLHFSILAKDSGLHEAIKLCRNWQEFWELNILSIFHYFPAASWLRWKGGPDRQNLLQLVSHRFTLHPLLHRVILATRRKLQVMGSVLLSSMT